MAYTIKKTQIEAWFAAFRNVNGWKLHLTKGINADRVQGFLRP
jgi:2-keto-4-pentenoate hydratase